MKTTKMKFSMLAALLLTMLFSFGQDKQPTMFNVHIDNVNFAKMPQYEKVAKEMKASFEKHNIQDADWIALTMSDGRYVYVSPISSMADLDKNPFAELSEKMGKDAVAKMFDTMNECYDSHSNSISHYLPELSYHPEGYSTDGKNFREYHFLYYPPRNAKAMKEGMKKVKDMFAAKGVKNGYSVFHSGFGSPDSYYMISIAGDDDVAIAMGGKENDKVLGEDSKATFFEVISLTSKYDKVEGRMRPDLSYKSVAKK